MKKRFSVYKSEFSNKREEDYRRMCDDIIFKHEIDIACDGETVAIKSNEITVSFKIDRPEKKWYEIWLKLKNIV